MGPVLGIFAIAGSRLVLAGAGFAVWLISRPGGWAVLVLLILFGLRVIPNTPQ